MSICSVRTCQSKWITIGIVFWTTCTAAGWSGIQPTRTPLTSTRSVSVTIDSRWRLTWITGCHLPNFRIVYKHNRQCLLSKHPYYQQGDQGWETKSFNGLWITHESFMAYQFLGRTVAVKILYMVVLNVIDGFSFPNFHLEWLPTRVYLTWDGSCGMVEREEGWETSLRENSPSWPP